jgi:CHASE3 domain sensor protein
LRSLSLLRVTLAINIVITLAAMTLAYRALRHADDSGRLVIRSHLTLQATEETLRRAVDTETGARSFILTHHAADLDRFNSAHQSVLGSLDDLTAMLTADGRGEAAAAVRFNLLATLAQLDGMVRHGNSGEAVQAADSDAARANMDALRAAIRTIRQAENDKLNARIQTVDRAERRVNWLLIVMTGLATALMTMLVASLVFVTRPGAWR